MEEPSGSEQEGHLRLDILDIIRVECGLEESPETNLLSKWHWIEDIVTTHRKVR